MGNRTAVVKVFPGSGELIRAAAEQFVRLARRAISMRGTFSVALSGGSTPRPLYALLGTEPFSRRIDWPRIHVFWGDERCVPPEDPRSNYLLACETLLERVPIPPDHVHRIHGEADPGVAAADYERVLRSFFSTEVGRPRASFDLVLLGMGPDGHTASLFPGSPAVAERGRWVAAEYVESVSMWRITLTPVVVNTARNIVFLVSGPGKAAALQEVMHGPYQPERLPAQAINPPEGRLTWLLDSAAAAGMNTPNE